MSTSTTPKQRTVPSIVSMKGVEPIVALTAYSTPVAKILDAHCDVLLVGDSVGMVIYGMETTLGVTLDMMIAHGQAVTRGSKKALVVVDLPFSAYECSPEKAFEAAAKVMALTQASAVKLEGGEYISDTIKFLTDRGIPVMGHVGLTPQAVNTIGGYRVVGRDSEAKTVIRDAQAVAEAGAFSVVLEKIPANLAQTITSSVKIPTIGIGASASCDGQILVVDDMLGAFTEFRPKFVKRYAELAKNIDEAVQEYAREVKQGEFPLDIHNFQD